MVSVCNANKFTGEGALLAMDGSALGIGTDIGGSIRIPAHYCGIYALKPGWARSSTEGTTSEFRTYTEVLLFHDVHYPSQVLILASKQSGL